VIQTQQYRYFLDSIASEATKKTYAYHLRQFCRHFKTDDCVRLVDTNIHPSLTEAQIIDYIVHLKSKGNSFSSINVALAAILHFYLINNVTLNRKKISLFLGKHVVKIERGRAYSIEQIAKILTVCDERTKALILLLASTGVRIGAIPQMKRKHFTPLVNDISMIYVYDGEYFTFCTPEASKALDEYFQYRERCGEKFGPNTLLFASNSIEKIY
jgi:site-specific recombinase XerD